MRISTAYFIKNHIVTGIALIVLAGCSQKMYKDIQSNYDRSTDFKQYKTFAWLPDKDSIDAKTLFGMMRNNTMNYFTHCMGERGYKANTDNPDVLLELIIKSETKEKEGPTLPKPFSTTTVTTYANPYLHPLSNPFKYNKPFTYKYFNYPSEKQLPKETYLKNSITLNVIDRANQKIVWTGTAKADLYDTAYLQMNLHPVVYDILEQYPVKPYSKHRRDTKN
ncbi:MAG: DUF4136 domain-containing protein [Sphingobacteriales bacterium]|nr:DUF4136 domain-containing protein [Sphingobacteriales bacterium]MBI3718600.1 DUF4136 domain-containing protein [Sphingobacteriales bacterium]